MLGGAEEQDRDILGIEMELGRLDRGVEVEGWGKA